MLLHYLKTALRNLNKNKEQTIISIIGLIIGITCFSICMYGIRYQLSSNTKFPHYEKMCFIHWSNTKGERLSNTLEMGRLLEAIPIPAIEAVSITSHMGKKLLGFELPDEKDTFSIQSGIYINEGFTKVFSAKWIFNDPSLFQQPKGVVLSASTARKIYGLENPIGYHVKINDEENEISTTYIIYGVIEDLPKPNTFSFFESPGVYFCIEDDLPDNTRCIITLLTSRISVKQINELINKEPGYIIISPDYRWTSFSPHISTLKEEKQKPEVLLGWGSLFLIGLIILIVGIINFFSIYIGLFYNRTRELTLRKTLGAHKYTPFSHLFVETTIVMMIALALSFIFSEFIIYFISDSTYNIMDNIDLKRLIFQQIQYLPLLISLNILFSFIAFYRINHLNISRGIKGGTNDGRKHKFRNVMIGFQFFISLSFLGVGIAVYKQHQLVNATMFSSLSPKEKKQIFEIKLSSPTLKQASHILEQEIRKNIGVKDVLITGTSLIHIPSQVYSLSKEGEEIDLFVLEAGANLFSFLNIPVIIEDETDDNFSVLINEELYHLLYENSETETLTLDSVSFHITGVTNNFIPQIVSTNSPYQVKRPVKEAKYLYIKSQPGYEKETAEFLNKTIRKWVPDSIPFEIRTLKMVLDDALKEIKKIGDYIFALAIFCILINCLGIYSAITVDTINRRKEVAIRKINGASLTDIILLFGKLYISLFIIGSIFSIPLAWFFIDLYLQNYVISFNHNNLLFWLGILVLILLIICLTIGFRLYQIARINPAEEIKTE